MPTRAGAAPYPRRNLTDMAALRWIVIHHTQAEPGRPTAREIAAYQVGRTAHLEFPGIAYALYVESNGHIEWCQDLEIVTWHCGVPGAPAKFGVGVHNWWGIAVCYSGADPTEAQVSGLRAACDLIDAALGRRLERRGHREVSVGPNGPLTTCPGDAGMTAIETIR